ncbi:proteasome accessory factor PafA2 family protein [Nigerium massiliense]|uniref:proteasome accessory factor PafA2 family protein n=1 Tax=Nigerium massiliense TaxID=1522317 RepID=UPI000694C353|nr:proteasome accessory factor PafA2 family protein [Nigerium massiliense]
MALIGTETEFGIAAPDEPGLDPDVLSQTVVRHVAGPATPVFEGIHNRVLGNGARFYVDHGHPEYAGPESTTPTDATVVELAGDRLVAQAAARASEELGVDVAVFKNNTDGKGASYGYHENYLLRRDTPFARVLALLPAFLATRVIYTGAGRVGIGPAGETLGFQRSQRADFFERVSGLDTTRNRGLVNTRDEPHARPSRWRRLHVIPGDANRNPFATWLKLGTATLVLACLEDDALPAVDVGDPVAAFRAASREDVPRLALDAQRRFLDACAGHPGCAEQPEADEILAEWARVLDDLTADPTATADRLDWSAKRALLQRLQNRDDLAWDAPRLAGLDLLWAELSDRSPFEALRRAGRLIDWIDPDDVATAMHEPPSGTRAFTRGLLVREHADRVIAATWDSVLVQDSSGGLHNLKMTEPVSWTAAEIDPAWTLDRILRHE